MTEKQNQFGAFRHYLSACLKKKKKMLKKKLFLLTNYLFPNITFLHLMLSSFPAVLSKIMCCVNICKCY